MSITPPPWRVRWFGDEPNIIEGNLKDADTEKWYGEWVCTFNHMVPEAQDRQRSNAKLIEVAPDLLQALRDVLERIDLAGGLKDPVYKGGAPWAIKRARMLVSKFPKNN